MTIEHLQTICKKLPAVTEDIKWEAHLCFNVGEKMFIITSPDEVPVNASFKVNDDDFELLCARPGFKPAPYLARHKWVQVDDISRIAPNEWERLLKNAHALVAAKLPAALRKKLGLFK